MRNLAVLTFVTLDGVMQAPVQPDEDPSDGFKHGSWCLKYWDEVMAQVMEEAMAAPYDLLLGRKTYQSFAAHWPNADKDNPIAEKLNNATKYVATSSLSKLEWQNSGPILRGSRVSAETQKVPAWRFLQVNCVPITQCGIGSHPLLNPIVYNVVLGKIVYLVLCRYASERR